MPGTGIGPFLSILRTAAPWQRFSRIVLAWSVRYQAELVYQPLIDRLAEQHPDQLVYLPAVTGAKHPVVLGGIYPGSNYFD